MSPGKNHPLGKTWRRAPVELPGKGWEEAFTIVDGEEVRRGSARPEVDRMILDANSWEARRRRMVAGWDLNDWLLPLNDLLRGKRYVEAISLLEEISLVCVTLIQYDNREPHAYWAEKLCTAHTRSGNKPAARAVLTEWLTHWPDTRFRTNQDVERITRRLERLPATPRQ